MGRTQMWKAITPLNLSGSLFSDHLRGRSGCVDVDTAGAVRRKKTPGVATGGPSENGAGEEARTLDVHLGKVVLYQLSYARKRGVG